MHRFAILLSLAVFILIIAGGLVTSTGSGLSVPDWPLSYGQIFPPMIGGIRFEHTHRVIAGFVGILTLIFMIALLRFEKRCWVKNLGIIAFLAVAAQAVLGGLTVIYLLPIAVSVTHACLAQSFFSLVMAITLFTSREWVNAVKARSANSRSVQRLSLVVAIFSFCQLLTGAIVRHTHGHGIAFHLIFAFLVLLHILLVSLKIMREDISRQKLSSHTFLLGALALAQISLGLGAYIVKYLRASSEMPTVGAVLLSTAHQSLGALILAGSVLLVLRAHRLLTS